MAGIKSFEEIINLYCLQLKYTRIFIVDQINVTVIYVILMYYFGIIDIMCTSLKIVISV